MARLHIELNLADELLAALDQPEIRAQLAGLVREAVRAELSQPMVDGLLTQKQVAELRGLSVPAFTMRRRRTPELDGMSLGEGKLRRWRRQELEQWLRTPAGPGRAG